MNHPLFFSIYDKKNGRYNNPTVYPSAIDCLRSVGNYLSKPEQSNLHSYPADFAIYEMGYFNADEGHIVSIGTPKFLEEITNLHPDCKGTKT